jgi:hypothetical protein
MILFFLAPNGSAGCVGIVACREGGGLLITGLMLPVVTRVSPLTQSMFSAWHARTSQGV